MSEVDGTISIERNGEQLLIAVTSFSTSEIDVMLSGMSDLDWRSTVEQVALDFNYDGKNFQPDMIDMPAAAIDFVKESYSIPVEKIGVCVAVKITDIFGESVIISQMVDIE